jgi:hypothetical protein
MEFMRVCRPFEGNSRMNTNEYIFEAFLDILERSRESDDKIARLQKEPRSWLLVSPPALSKIERFRKHGGFPRAGNRTRKMSEMEFLDQNARTRARGFD